VTVAPAPALRTGPRSAMKRLLLALAFLPLLGLSAYAQTGLEDLIPGNGAAASGRSHSSVPDTSRPRRR